MATVTGKLYAHFFNNFRHVLVHTGDTCVPKRTVTWTWDIESNNVTGSFLFMGEPWSVELREDELETFLENKAPELLKDMIKEKLQSCLDWHCEGYSKKYVRQLHKLYDMDQACEEGKDLFYSGEKDLDFIKDTIFDKYLELALKDMTVEE